MNKEDLIISMLKNFTEDFKELKGEFKELKSDFKELKGEFKELKNEVAKLKNEFGEIKENLNELTNVVIIMQVEHGQKLDAALDKASLAYDNMILAKEELGDIRKRQTHNEARTMLQEDRIRKLEEAEA